MIRLVLLTSLVVLGLFGSQQVFAGIACNSNVDCNGDDVCVQGFCQEACVIVCLVADPVCGEDGVTYFCGEPDAACHGVAVSHIGECEILVGGKLIPIDSTSLILVGAQMTVSWLLPVLVAGAGIGLFVVSRKSKNS